MSPITHLGFPLLFDSEETHYPVHNYNTVFEVRVCGDFGESLR